MKSIVLPLFGLLISSTSFTAASYPKLIKAPGGEVIIPNEQGQKNYDEYHFAPARRFGDTIYVSGVVIGQRPGEGTDVKAFKLQARRGFERLGEVLKASGASFADVVMMNSFHIWQGPNFSGTKEDQIAAFEEIMAEYIHPPWPTWTAVGTTGLFAPTGIVEVQLIARIKP